MGSLQLLTQTNRITGAEYALAGVMALPLAAVVITNLYPYIDGIAAAEAVVLFGAIGGISGLISQAVAANMLNRLSRQVNALELLPAISGSVLASAAVTYALLPPNPNPVTSILQQSGSLPN
jgi:dihydroorotate dehydrogenase